MKKRIPVERNLLGGGAWPAGGDRRGDRETPPPLETLIDRYEEGMNLLRTCRERLDAAEKRIEIIGRDARGNAVLEPFEEA